MKRSLTAMLSLAGVCLLCAGSWAAAPDVLRFRVETKGGPTLAYWAFSDARHTFRAGEALEYDVYLKGKWAGVGGIDVVTKHSMRLRALKPRDAAGLDAGPKSDLSKVAAGKWYHRRIAIPAQLVGEEAAEWLVTVDGVYDTGARPEAAYRNVRVTNGKSCVAIYNGGKPAINLPDSANERTLKEAVLIGQPLDAPIRTTIDWFNSMLPADKYIGMHAEAYDPVQKKWVTGCPNYQPIKSSVFRPWNVAFWRKDDMQDFYGELYTYDLTALRLHTETMPPPVEHEPAGRPAWDARPDRSRVFVQTSNGHQYWHTDRSIVYDWGDPSTMVRFTTGNAQWKFGVEQKAGEDWSMGRALAPVDGTTDWQFHGTVNTYIANDYAQLSNGTAPLMQLSIVDYATVTRETNFSTVYDGEADGWKADPEFKNFDEAYIINQHMNDNAARERFICARRGNTYYGVVRWDVSEFRDGKWVVTGRATGLKQMTKDDGFSFAGMYDRVRNDAWIKPHELDMDLPQPKSAPATISGSATITLRNIGLKTWTPGVSALYGRLMTTDWKPVEGSEVKLADMGSKVASLASAQVSFARPAEWKSGEYFLVLEMKDGDKWFSKSGSIPFVKRMTVR